jgi:hypothetical protein
MHQAIIQMQTTQTKTQTRTLTKMQTKTQIKTQIAILVKTQIKMPVIQTTATRKYKKGCTVCVTLFVIL